MEKYDNTKRAARIISRLKKEFPEARTALVFSDPLQLLVSTILSAQCTDVRVNIVTPALFVKYRQAKDFAAADRNELEAEIKSTGFYRMKAKHIMEASSAIVNRFYGQVPQTLEELMSLPGVGRKTANCVLGGAFGIQSGIVVDTHVIRLSNRLGLTKNESPDKIEQDLIKLVPRKEWYRFSNLLILHGRKTCKARRPLCEQCVLSDDCPSSLI
ncbi:MAG: endonuclease III [Calditrichaeota bacterium]|nr:MAG: endonuclease III [Calditrichota bacterium]